ncbi:MAG: transglutaminase-like domain-containing protein [Treponema sp.]|nr:transglutaminase-like domain-containing protein [Treponema sp.]
MANLLEKTALLDFESREISSLIKKKKWLNLDEKEKVKQIYEFIRDEISFGYNVDDAIPASRVLKDGYGQCNTKGILFMAILRAVNIPCRIHGFTVDKKLQKGALKGCYYKLSPKEIVHSWIEILYKGKWYNLEGFILDRFYLTELQKKFSDCNTGFCGYGVAVKDFKNPSIDWNENDTYIQSESIVQDFGVFESPDELFAKHFQKLSAFKKFMFRYIIRHLMNKNVGKIRKTK